MVMTPIEVLRRAKELVENSAELAIIKATETKRERIRALVLLHQVRADPDNHHRRMVEDLDRAIALAGEEENG